MRTSEVLTGIKSRLAFDPSVTRKIPAVVLAKAQAIARRASLHADSDEMELQEAIHVFAAEDDLENSNGARFYFHNDTRGRSIERAELHLYIDKPDTNPSERREVSINVYEASEGGVKGELLASHRVLTSTHRHAHHRVRVNAEALERIAQRDVTTLIVEAVCDDVNLVVLPGDEDAVEHPLSLALIMKETRRTRRAITFCKVDKPVQACCVFQHQIDFQELGWESVVAPSKINVMGCAGYCPGRDAKPDFNGEPSREALYQAAGVSPSCCHPTQYEDQQMVYITPSDNIVETVIKDLYVVKCGCS
ncbi:hypothetical protein PENTCL1PPCAC_30508 [Pristionchus entomophagus]|nr:hypothetical protein PENTCL1PPCAC_30508 [Pristionchus entomophagus]